MSWKHLAGLLALTLPGVVLLAQDPGDGMVGERRPQSAFPVSSRALIPPVEPTRVARDSLGDNGLVVDPYTFRAVMAVALPPGICGIFVPSHTQIATRCGDDDGCAVRIASVGANRSISPTTMFTVDSTGNSWTRAKWQVGGSVDSGDIDDVAALLRSDRSDGETACSFETFPLFPGGRYELLNCFDNAAEADTSGNHTCVLRVDD